MERARGEELRSGAGWGGGALGREIPRAAAVELPSSGGGGATRLLPARRSDS